VTPDELTTAIASKAEVAGTPENLAVLKLGQSVVPFSGTLIGNVIVEVHDQHAQAAAPAVPEPATITATVRYRYPFQIASLNIGVLFVLGVLALAVYGVVIGGWASNNKYSFLGGLRATAQMISYEIPLGLCVLCIVVMFGTLDLGQIVDRQAHYWYGFIPAWNVFAQPLTFLMFLVCIHAEANRAPFDLAEAEQELVGGYHTEYSAMRFALFFLAEYAGMITTSAVCVALFFGGWQFPFVDHLVCGLENLARSGHWTNPQGALVDAYNPAVTTSLALCIVRCLVFYAKTLVIIFVFMWTRWSLPRFRFDQLMTTAWRAMIPMSLALLLVTSVVVYEFGGLPGADPFAPIISGPMAGALILANIVVLAATMALSLLLPAPLAVNRRLKVAGSRFSHTPLPGHLPSALSQAASSHPRVTVEPGAPAEPVASA
jgi:NADH-quinone oxidoreductase subunit H